VWVTVRRRRPATLRVELIEIVTPRTNRASITAAENLLAAISFRQPFSLEIAVTREQRWFLARADDAGMRAQLVSQLAVAYPQARLRQLDLERYPGLDPARRGPDEQVAVATLRLQGPLYLPLRTFADRDVAAEPAAQADPILGILGTLADLPDDWRALIQLVLRPAPDNWSRPYHRLALEHPLEVERALRSHSSVSSGLDPLMVGLIALLVGSAVVLQGYQWYVDHDWLDLSALVGAPPVGIAGLLWLKSRLGGRTLYDPRLVDEKIRRPAYQTELRLAVFAPTDAPRGGIGARLHRLAAAYRPFSLATGNGLVPRQLELGRRDLRALTALTDTRTILNLRELAGLWHLPPAGTDVPLLERTAARQRLPLPVTVARGCPIGASVHQEQHVPVALSDALLRRHLLLVAKTGRGKSSLLLRLFSYLATRCARGAKPPALVVVDPHRDLARAALGLVPPERRDDVVVLDVAERERPFGLNLIDAGLGWERDQAVANVLTIFRHQFDEFWGPRMEDAFRFALLSLFEVNQALCAADPLGRLRQHTVLAVPSLLTMPAFRRSVLEQVSDPYVKAWWTEYYDPLDRRFQLEVANPVQTKVQRFVGSRAARNIVGQPRSTVEPTEWLRDGKIVIVQTAKGTVGEDTAALIGATILNLLALVIQAQAVLPPGQRRQINLLVDELHTMPGADYETYLAELAKYGASLTLATQSLKRLDALDREQHRALRATLFANLDGLFAFQVSAEDARYLTPELGGEVDEEDLTNLADYQCYARLSVNGERVPPFSVNLDPPPPSDERLANELATTSARRDGRHWTAVERDLQAALDRIVGWRKAVTDSGAAGQAGSGVARGVSGGSGSDAPKTLPAKGERNDHREKKPTKPPEQQPLLFNEGTLVVQAAGSGDVHVDEESQVEHERSEGRHSG